MTYDSQLLGAKVYTDEKLVFFYGGIFSQWAKCDFFCQSLDIPVNCAEQAMMLHKAKLFNDEEAYFAIQNNTNPREQKAIGRQIKNWDDKAWDEVKYELVRGINYDKFTQSPAWKELLFFTQSYLLVEASPYDKIWGIGIGVDNPDLLKQETWGQNLLGKAITEVRQGIFGV